MKKVFKYGEKIGHFTYISEAETIVLPSGQKPRRINCKCTCGNIINSILSHVSHNKTKTCGQCKKSKLEKNEHKSSLYNSWRGMKNRCKPSYFQKQYYYDKGISVCKEWGMYSNFKKWAISNGHIDGLQIDRIDNSLGYYPNNCRFVTQEYNLSNRDVTYKVIYNDKLIPFMTLLRYKNIPKNHYPTIYIRIRRGWSIEKAIDTPIKNGNYKTKRN